MAVSISPFLTNAEIYLRPTPEDRQLARYPESRLAQWEAQTEEAGHVNGTLRNGLTDR